MILLKALLAGIFGGLISIVIIGGAGTLAGLSIQLPAYGGLAAIGCIASVFALRVIPLRVFVVAWMVLCLLLISTWGVIIILWPETHYEKIIGYLFVAGSVGALLGGFAMFKFRVLCLFVKKLWVS